MISRTFKLCLNAGSGSAPYINVNQYDEGETWLFELYSENGERYIPSSGAIVGVKSDGHGIANTGTVDSEGRVVITETQQMTASAGRAIYELSIDGLTHGTANFIVAVERKPTDDAVMSDSDLSLIQEAIDSAEVIVEVIGDGDPSDVIGEHVDAWLDAHPEATTTVQDGAITAPKINQSLWDKLLVSESASGNPASFDDGADDVPVSSLKVALEPIQLGSGDPSPSNIRPIYPANGKNLFDEANATVYTRYIDATSWIHSADSASYVFPCSPSTQYTVTAFNTNLTIFRIGCLNETFDPSSTATLALTHVTRLTTASSITVTTDANTQYIVIQINSTLANNAQVQIELGSASPYQPYQGIMVERTGKNLLDASTFVNKAWNGPNTYSTMARPTSAIIVPVGSVITVSVSSDFLSKYVYAVLQMDKDFPASSTVGDSGWRSVATTTVTMASQYLGINIKRIDNGDVDLNDLKNMQIQVEYGSTATEYVPFVEGNTYYMQIGQSVYGGTVDLATGVLTVTKGYADLGTLNWEYANGMFLVTVPNFASPTNYVERMSGFILSNYVADRQFSISITSMTDKTALRLGGNIYLKDTSYTTVSAFTAANDDMQMVYELATPIIVQLTPQEVKTLLGYNNISSSGTVDVIYHADTKLYVDKMTSVDNAIIAPTEADFVATRNYTVNDLVIVNDTLYKVTTNIASGSAITPNSNVQQTTLGALIKALS